MTNSNNFQVKKELLHLATSNSFLSAIALFLNIVIINIVFWDISSKLFLSSWLLSITALLIYRSLLSKQFLSGGSKLSIESVEKRYKTVTLLSGIIVGVGIVIVVPEGLPFHQAFLSMIVAGLSAGAVMSLSYYKNLIRNYLLILILPFSLVIYMQNSQVHSFIALLMILFLAMLVMFSKKYNENIVNVIKSKLLIEKAEKELELSENNFSSIFKEAPIGIFTYDKELIIQEANQAFASLLKAPLDEIIHLDMKKLKDKSIYPSLDIVLNSQKGFYEGNYQTTLSGEEIWVSMQTAPMYDIDHKIKGGLGIVEDITERIESEKKIRYQAFYDHLTGLANRLTLTDRLQQQLSRLNRHHRFGAILFIDIDHFKTINDSLGHHIGDALLKTFATRASSIVRQEDTVSRLGGDEFVILLSDLSDNKLIATQYANEMAEKLHQLMKEPIEHEKHLHHITISIGVTLIGVGNNNINDILKHADIAMYKAKELGRDTTCFFEEEMSQQIKEQHLLDHELREAVKENHFELYYQPIVESKTSKITSCEALIRWNHPTKGVIFPDDFIPYAESSGFIIALGNWVIQRACQDYKNLKNDIQSIAINISPKQFNQESFVEDILKIINEHEIEPSLFKLELTESVAVDNLYATIEKMNLLKTHGFSLAMDDFGTGYSSLSYLKNLPFDFLKIDRSFIKNILENEDDASLVKTILTISKQFNFAVIAEGVETLEHVNFLKALDCEYYQGYVISKPLPLKEFKKLFTKVS